MPDEIIDIPESTLEERVAAHERVKAKARANLAKRGKSAADLLAEYAVLELAPLVPLEEVRSVGIWLHPNAFTSAARSHLWAGCVAEAEADRSFDLVVAAGNSDLARAEAITISTISPYTLPLCFERHARTVAEWAAYRDAASEIHDAQDVTGCTPMEALARIAAVHVTMPATNAEAAAQAVASAYDLAKGLMSDYYGTNTDGPRISTTIPALDDALDGGLQSDRPTVVGASTGVGKTAFAIQVACTAARNVPVYVVNAESTRKAWRARACAHVGRIVLSDILNKSVENPMEFADAVDAVGALKLYIDDGRIKDGRPNLDVYSVCERILTQHKKTPLGLVVIDYITKLTIRGRYDRNDLRVGDISDRLAALCKQLGCPVLVLSQLNGVEPGRAPTRDNIAESKKVAHDAGVVMLIWTPENDRPENVEILVDKAGLSAKGHVPARFLGSIQRYEPRQEEPKPFGGNGNGAGGVGKRGRKFGKGESHD